MAGTKPERFKESQITLGLLTNPDKIDTNFLHRGRKPGRDMSSDATLGTLTHLLTSFYQETMSPLPYTKRITILNKKLKTKQYQFFMPRSKPRPGANVDKYMLRTEELRKNSEHVGEFLHDLINPQQTRSLEF